MPTRYDFFIAHAGADQAAARDLRQQLRQRGHTAFVDADDAPAGALFDQLIPEAQRDSRVTLVLVSARSGQGYYDKEEIAAAIHLDRQRGHPVVPVVLDTSAVPDDMPYGLRRRVALFPERDGWPLVVDRLCALVGDFAPPESQRARLLALDKAIAKKPSNVEALRAERKALRAQMAVGEVLEPGRLFAGRYELEGLLGQGGFGQVWRAFDIDHSRFVALKVLHRDLDQRRCDRFKTGIRKQLALGHAHIAPVLSGAHTEGHRTFAVLRLLEGGDLARALTEGRLRAEQVPGLIQAVASALDHAHGEGVIHRDVKPSNLLLDDQGVVYLTDFDLVRADDTGGESHTRGVGTVLYLAPEVLEENGKVTPATDQYALAMTAVCLLSGRSLPARTIYRRPAAVAELPVVDAVKAVLHRGIADEPEARWGSILEFAQALAGAMASGQPARPIQPGDVVAPATTFRPALRYAPPGPFTMGSPPDEPGRFNDEVEHPVTLTRPLWVMETPVTRAQWTALLGSDPSYFKRDPRLPVECINWFEAVAFANALSEREGLPPAYEVAGPSGTLGGGLKPGEASGVGDFRFAQVKLRPHATGYRLPTEAEWEYLARAGTQGAIYAGSLKILGERNAPALDPIAWYGGNSGTEHAEGIESKWTEMQKPAARSATQPVGQKAANPWGLRDLLGNVWEWCEDWYGPYEQKSISDPAGPPTGGLRVVRGGSWGSGARRVRAAYRVYVVPVWRVRRHGFRLVRAPSS